jgi:hypothetical protein
VKFPPFFTACFSSKRRHNAASGIKYPLCNSFRKFRFKMPDKPVDIHLAQVDPMPCADRKNIFGHVPVPGNKDIRNLPLRKTLDFSRMFRSFLIGFDPSPLSCSSLKSLRSTRCVPADRNQTDRTGESQEGKRPL